MDMTPATLWDTPAATLVAFLATPPRLAPPTQGGKDDLGPPLTQPQVQDPECFDLALTQPQIPDPRVLPTARTRDLNLRPTVVLASDDTALELFAEAHHQQDTVLSGGKASASHAPMHAKGGGSDHTTSPATLLSAARAAEHAVLAAALAEDLALRASWWATAAACHRNALPNAHGEGEPSPPLSTNAGDCSTVGSLNLPAQSSVPGVLPTTRTRAPGARLSAAPTSGDAAGKPPRTASHPPRGPGLENGLALRPLPSTSKECLLNRLPRAEAFVGLPFLVQRDQGREGECLWYAFAAHASELLKYLADLSVDSSTPTDPDPVVALLQGSLTPAGARHTLARWVEQNPSSLVVRPDGLPMVSVAAIVRRRCCELLDPLDALKVSDATNCDDRTLLASYCTHVRTMGTYGGIVELSLWSSMIGVCTWAIIQGGAGTPTSHPVAIPSSKWPLVRQYYHFSECHWCAAWPQGAFPRPSAGLRTMSDVVHPDSLSAQTTPPLSLGPGMATLEHQGLPFDEEDLPSCSKLLSGEQFHTGPSGIDKMGTGLFLGSTESIEGIEVGDFVPYVSEVREMPRDSTRRTPRSQFDFEMGTSLTAPR